MLVCEEEFKMKVLKKSLVLLLVGALLVSCLTGCSEKPEPVTPTGTEVTKPIEKPAPVAYVNREDAVVLRADNKDDEVFKKFDSIYKEMENYCKANRVSPATLENSRSDITLRIFTEEFTEEFM